MSVVHGADTSYVIIEGLRGETFGMLNLRRETFGVNFRPRLSKRLRQIPGIGSLVTVYRWRHGPVLSPSGEAHHLLSTILGAVEERARQEGIAAIEGVTLAGYADEFAPDLAALMRERGYEATPSATFLVDLALSEKELLRACHRSVRKNIHRCTRNGIKVERVMSDEGWREFALLFNASRRSQGLPVRSLRHITLHNELLNRGDERRVELFLARHNGRAIAALCAFAFNGWLTEAMSVNSDYALEHRLPAQDLLKWKIMRWGKAEGFRTFDLAGVAPSPKTHKEVGIKRFKAKFGGRYVEYGTYRKVFRPTAYRLLAAFKGWRGP